MFKKAIETVGGFTRPIHMISNFYGEKEARPGAGTLFFVNDEAVAITCRHISAVIRQSYESASRFQEFQKEKAVLARSGSFNRRIRDLKARYGYDQPDQACQVLFQFVDCADFSSIDIIEHPVFDLAILKFKGFTRKFYSGHASFARDSNELQPGVFMCRLGFPFPEFTNYRFDESTESIHWTSDPSRMVRFPLEGMVTRHFGEPDGSISGVEISTPGLRGQSGGPLFNSEGVIYGMQSRTNHLHLGFDMKNAEILSEGKKLRINNQPFLHVGMCVHVDVIRGFLRQHGISFTEV